MARLGKAGTEWHGVVWRDGATPRQPIGRKVMVKELIKELRSYPEHYVAAHRAADALEKAERNMHAREYHNIYLEDQIIKLEQAAESMRECIAQQQLDIVTLGQEVGRLREALEKIADDGNATGCNPQIMCNTARAALGEEKR
jgi:hypothetical protein